MEACRTFKAICLLLVISFLTFIGCKAADLRTPADLFSGKETTDSSARISLAGGDIEVIPINREGKPTADFLANLSAKLEGNVLRIYYDGQPRHYIYLDIRYNVRKLSVSTLLESYSLSGKRDLLYFMNNYQPGKVALVAAVYNPQFRDPQDLNGYLGGVVFSPVPESSATVMTDRSPEGVSNQPGEPMVVVNPDNPDDPQAGVDFNTCVVRAELRVRGDNDADGDVDNDDGNRFAAAFGKRVGDYIDDTYGYVREADDFYPDGFIDFADVNYLVNAYGLSITEIYEYHSSTTPITMGDIIPSNPDVIHPLADVKKGVRSSGWAMLEIPIPPSSTLLYAAYLAAGTYGGPYIDDTISSTVQVSNTGATTRDIPANTFSFILLTRDRNPVPLSGNCDLSYLVQSRECYWLVAMTGEFLPEIPPNVDPPTLATYQGNNAFSDAVIQFAWKPNDSLSLVNIPEAVNPGPPDVDVNPDCATLSGPQGRFLPTTDDGIYDLGTQEALGGSAPLFDLANGLPPLFRATILRGKINPDYSIDWTQPEVLREVTTWAFGGRISGSSFATEEVVPQSDVAIMSVPIFINSAPGTSITIYLRDSIYSGGERPKAPDGTQNKGSFLTFYKNLQEEPIIPNLQDIKLLVQ